MFYCFTDEELDRKYVERFEHEDLLVKSSRNEVNYSCLYQAIAETLPSAQLAHILQKMEEIRTVRLNSESASPFERQCFDLPNPNYLQQDVKEMMHRQYTDETVRKLAGKVIASTTAKPSPGEVIDAPPLSGQSLPVLVDPGARPDSESHE